MEVAIRLRFLGQTVEIRITDDSCYRFYDRNVLEWAFLPRRIPRKLELYRGDVVRRVLSLLADFVIAGEVLLQFDKRIVPHLLL
jgi:hypothetical protein